MKNVRIKTTIDGSDKYIPIKLEQSFDFLEILSLTLSQEDVYRKYSADYGVVVGRCFMNGAVGIPNVKVSIFIKLDDNDKDDINVTSLYPFESPQTLNSDNTRYNLLPRDPANICHVPVGDIPNKNNILDNPEMTEIYDKYYKYTTTTNAAGDYMFFGIPVGNHVVIADVDLSDIGIFSQKPYDFIEQGSNIRQFESPSQFKSSNNLSVLSQIKNVKSSVNVIPFWSDPEVAEAGINRLDIDLGYELKPMAIFMGSIFGDNEKNSVNKNCRPRKKLGNLCETITNEGSIGMIRETIGGQIERYDVEGGRVIDENGAWAYRIPMNLDYVITGEDGTLIPTEDTTKGIPTRSRVRFKIGMDESGDVGRVRARAKYLVPHNPKNITEEDYSFDQSTSNKHFRDLYWNKIYTVRNHITRTQSACGGNCADNRRMIGIKNVDDCVGTKNPFPYNKLDGDFNPIFTILCLIMSVIISILSILNGILSFIYNIKIVGKRFFSSVKCIGIQCNDQIYSPGCSGKKPSGTVSTSADETHECYKVEMAEALNVFELDFYNDWVNGTLFSFLLKYKKKKNKAAKFCNIDNDESMYVVNTIFFSDTGGIGLGSNKNKTINSGVIKEFDGELFYGAFHKSGVKLYPTDIYELGAVFDCDWQGKPKVNNLLIPTSYQIPPKINEEPGVSEFANDGSPNGVLFNFSCVKMSVNDDQIRNIQRICEIGVGLDEARDNSLQNRIIDINEIENKFLRDALLYLNNPTLDPASTISSDFTDSGLDYQAYRAIDNSSNLRFSKGNSLYFYFGTEPGLTALDKMNGKYFTECIINGEPAFTINGTVTDVTSIGGSDGAIDIEIVGGTEPFTYEWSNGYTVQDISNLPIGEYIVIVTDFNGNKVRKIFNVREPQPLTTFISQQNLTSLTTPNGIITVESIFGGNQPYKITLSGAYPTTVINNVGVDGHSFSTIPVTGGAPVGFLPAGNYVVVVSDSSTPIQSVSNNVTLLAPKVLRASQSTQNVSCYGEFNGTIDINIISGNPPYRFHTTSPTAQMIQLSDSGPNAGQEVLVPFIGNTQLMSGLGPGVYNIEVRDVSEQVVNLTTTITQPSTFPIMIQRIVPNYTNLFRIVTPFVNSDNVGDFTFYLNDVSVGNPTYSFGLNSNLPPGAHFHYGALANGDKIYFEDGNGCQSHPIIIQTSPTIILTYNGSSNSRRFKVSNINPNNRYSLFRGTNLEETSTAIPANATFYEFGTRFTNIGSSYFYVIEFEQIDGIFTQKSISNTVNL